MKFNNKYKKFILFPVLFILLILFQNQILFSRFIIDENEDILKESNNRTSRKEGLLPDYIASGIRAESVPDAYGSVKVTWNNSLDYKGQFVLGRYHEVINTKDNVLRSKTLKTFNPALRNVYVDSGLKPGRYYYVVIAKEKLAKRDIELYMDINYTTYPAIVDKFAKSKKTKYITGILAEKIGKTKVLITWNRLSTNGVIYTVYREKRPLSLEKDIIPRRRIGSITDGGHFVDDKFSLTGTYYYAVTAKPHNSNEMIILTPDQTYTTSSIFIYTSESFVVHNINARLTNRNIRVKWDKVTEGIKYNVQGFGIYRSNEPIIDTTSLNKAIHLKSINGNMTEFLDINPGMGRYYYAVLVKYTNGQVDLRLKTDYNTTSQAIDTRKYDDEYKIDRISASRSGREIYLTWDYSGFGGNSVFRLFRSRKLVHKVSEIRIGNIMDEVDITKNSYKFKSTKIGRFYYGLIPLQKNTDKDIRIIRGVNITSRPISLSLLHPELYKYDLDEYRPDRIIPKSIMPEEIELRGYDLDDIDKIIRESFFKGKYYRTIKELQYILRNTDDNIKVAKANLFIGRSYIEIEEFSKALTYLSKMNVRKYFPAESDFWREFAMLRIR